MQKELLVQTFLRSNGTFEQLKEKYGINICTSTDGLLSTFNYDQIESPKTDPLTCQCRALILENGTWNVAGRLFDRFWNIDEVLEEFNKFNWNDFEAYSKEDGSLIHLYYSNGWHFNTRGSFAQGLMPDNRLTWAQMIESILPMVKINSLNLNKDYSYGMELTCLANKIVRTYTTPSLYLLAVFNKYTHEELSRLEVDTIAHFMDVKRPEFYAFHSRNEVEAFLKWKEEVDATWEGLVLKDSNNRRIKVKTRTYFSLHKLHNNGAIYLDKNLVPWALKEDSDELLIYFPEAVEMLKLVKLKIDAAWDILKELWEKNHRVESQKEFALIVKSNPFCSILFRLRQQKGAAQTIDDLKLAWRGAEDIIAKRLFE